MSSPEDIFADLPAVDPALLAKVPSQHEPWVAGEDLGVNLDRPAARYINDRVSEAGDNEYIHLEGLGEFPARDTRYRDSAKQGFLKAYVRTHEFTEDHKVVTTIGISTLALGAVLAGAAALRHRKK